MRKNLQYNCIFDVNLSIVFLWFSWCCINRQYKFLKCLHLLNSIWKKMKFDINSHDRKWNGWENLKVTKLQAPYLDLWRFSKFVTGVVPPGPTGSRDPLPPSKLAEEADIDDAFTKYANNHSHPDHDDGLSSPESPTSGRQWNHRMLEFSVILNAVRLCRKIWNICNFRFSWVPGDVPALWCYKQCSSLHHCQS